MIESLYCQLGVYFEKKFKLEFITSRLKIRSHKVLCSMHVCTIFSKRYISPHKLKIFFLCFFPLIYRNTKVSIHTPYGRSSPNPNEITTVCCILNLIRIKCNYYYRFSRSSNFPCVLHYTTSESINCCLSDIYNPPLDVSSIQIHKYICVMLLQS